MSDADLPRPVFARSERSGGDGRTYGRVPPHNVQAEESLLGAMLLSRDAIAAAVEIVNADDFYKPAHGHIFDAVTSLFAAGEPADPVTVAEELSRAGLLDSIGGPATLVTIQAATPATTSAARYARIVEEHALLRRLIGVAGEIAELGYDLPDDVTKAVDKAEALVFQVAQRRVADTLLPIRDLLSESLDRLEQLYERGEAITGLPTGYTDLDELLSGMQPSNLIVVGARPAMGKALALDTPIPTTSGWSTMADLRPGDEVFDENGRVCQVLYVSPVFDDRTCYEVEFDDGSTLVTDRDHAWLAYDHPAWKSLRARGYRDAAPPAAAPSLARDQSHRIKRPRVVTTQQMLDEGVRARNGERPNWYVPVAGALELTDAVLPADPYILGCWLGDGTSQFGEPHRRRRSTSATSGASSTPPATHSPHVTSATATAMPPPRSRDAGGGRATRARSGCWPVSFNRSACSAAGASTSPRPISGLRPSSGWPCSKESWTPTGRSRIATAPSS